jgi:hypothetical protein
MVEQPIVGQLVVYVTMDYRKPGKHNAQSTWSKLVTIHTEHHVTVEQAHEALTEWKKVNQNVVGKFTAALY